MSFELICNGTFGELSSAESSKTEASMRVLLMSCSSAVDSSIRWKGGNMIQKCANPECDTEFRYASRGRLFSFEIRHPAAPCRDVPLTICERKPSHATIHFWLCENCSSKLSLHFTREAGVSVTAISEPLGLCRTSKVMKPSQPALGPRSA